MPRARGGWPRAVRQRLHQGAQSSEMPGPDLLEGAISSGGVESVLDRSRSREVIIDIRTGGGERDGGPAPLRGVRVLTLAVNLPGPAAASRLCAMGASV